MGNCFSSKKQGQVLGSGPPSAGASAGASAPSVGGTPVSPSGNTIGGSGNPDDPRAAALRAAEARAQAVSDDGPGLHRWGEEREGTRMLRVDG